MSFWKRVALMTAVCAVQGLYFPLNRYSQGGVLLKTPLDDFIPLWPVWVAPYAATWLIWGASAVWAVWKMDDRRFYSALISLLTVIVIGLACFTLYPTYIERPALTGDAWDVAWLRFVYANDGLYNAFPSGHVYITTLIALIWARWYPRYRGVWFGVAAVIALSTLFTRQHYLPDPAGGLALALAGDWVGQGAAQLWEARRAPAGLTDAAG